MPADSVCPGVSPLNWHCHPLDRHAVPRAPSPYQCDSSLKNSKGRKTIEVLNCMNLKFTLKEWQFSYACVLWLKMKWITNCSFVAIYFSQNRCVYERERERGRKVEVGGGGTWWFGDMLIDTRETRVEKYMKGKTRFVGKHILWLSIN